MSKSCKERFEALAPVPAHHAQGSTIMKTLKVDKGLIGYNDEVFLEAQRQYVALACENDPIH